MQVNNIAPLSTRQHTYLQKTFASWLNVAEGGKRGGKNVLNAIAFALNLEEHPERLHLIAGVNIAAAKVNVIDCDGFGLANYFEGRCREGEYKKRDALFIKTRTGEKIVLVSGLGKDGDEKKIKGNTYGMVYITEVNECHPNGIQECFDRTLTSRDRKIFHDLNPKAEGHFYYTNILNFHEQKQLTNQNYGFNYGHFTIADNMSLTQEKIDIEIDKYDHKSVWFMRDILGQRKQAEGLVYPMFNPKIHVVPTISRPYEKYYISMDYGIQNPTAMGLWGLYKGVWYLTKEYYHSGRETNEQKTDEEYYLELEKLAGDLKIQQIIVDPSAASFITLVRRKGNRSVKGADNAVIDGIRETASALQSGKIKINDCCLHMIKEMGLYSWDNKAVEDKVIKDNDHMQDQLRYFVKTLKIAVPAFKQLPI